MIQKQPRFQVVLELKDGTTMPYGPVAEKRFCQRICEGINRGLVQGKRSPLNVTGAAITHVTAN